MYRTNLLETKSYHVAGRNHECIGLVLPGDFRNGRTPAPKQQASLPYAISYILSDYHRSVGMDQRLHLVGHKEIALPGHGTSCPGNLKDYA